MNDHRFTRWVRFSKLKKKQQRKNPPAEFSRLEIKYYIEKQRYELTDEEKTKRGWPFTITLLFWKIKKKKVRKT